MTDIALKIRLLREELPSSVKLVAVSKTRPVSDILEAYNSGHRIFGENRVQELLKKKDLLPADIEWHLVGHLQSNKVKSIVPFVSMIESVDSARLAAIISSEAEKAGRIIDCLLQIHIAEEESKFGFSMDEIHEMLRPAGPHGLSGIRICGVMGMATFTGDQLKIRREFRFLMKCYSEVKEKYFKEDQSFKEISMGMSGDFKIAVDEGSTIIRIGNLIFGERNKTN